MRLVNAVVAGAALAIVACGGSDSSGTNNPGACGTVSGAQAATGNTCTGAVAYGKSSNTFGVTVVANLTGLSVGIELGTGTARTGTFDQGSARDGGIVYMPSSPGAGPIWQAQVGGPGTFTLNLTELGPGTDVADGTGYVQPRGTLAATLKPVAGSGATGDVVLSVKF